MYKDPKCRYTLRVDAELLVKSHHVVKGLHRSLNQQIEFLLETMVKEYETGHGEIKIEWEDV